VRAGELSQINAVSGILQELESRPWLLAKEKDATFKLYYTEISEAELHTSGAVDRPRAQAAAESTEPQKDAKRTREHDMDSESECEDSSPVKKCQLRESEMPWNKHVTATGTFSNPSCAETVQLLKLYNNNVKGCKFYIHIASNAPKNIPSSQLEQIFKGEPVDLNQILSSLHHITLDEERKARLGGATISFGTTEPSWKVSTASEWSAAWRRATQAITFAFPHHAHELDDYVEGKFTTKHASAHQHIIWYESTVRNIVHGGQSVLLTDTQCFLNLYSAIVLSDGIQYGRGQTGHPEPLAKGTYAAASTMVCARVGCPADISMPAYHVTTQAMDKETAPQQRNEPVGLHPKYLQYNTWSPDPSLSATTTEWSEHAAPLP